MPVDASVDVTDASKSLTSLPKLTQDERKTLRFSLLNQLDKGGHGGTPTTRELESSRRVLCSQSLVYRGGIRGSHYFFRCQDRHTTVPVAPATITDFFQRR